MRSAEPDDIERLVALLDLGALVPGKEDPGHLGRYAAALSEIRSAPGNEVLVAEVDGVIVGMCQLVVFRHLQAGGGLCAEIESLHVHPDARSQGVGMQLLAAAVDAARRSGCYPSPADLECTAYRCPPVLRPPRIRAQPRRLQASARIRWCRGPGRVTVAVHPPPA